MFPKALAINRPALLRTRDEYQSQRGRTAYGACSICSESNAVRLREERK